MTNEEVAIATRKFLDYLAANGVDVLCLGMYLDEGPTGNICAVGNTDMLTEMMLIAVAHKHGWKVVPQ